MGLQCFWLRGVVTFLSPREWVTLEEQAPTTHVIHPALGSGRQPRSPPWAGDPLLPLFRTRFAALVQEAWEGGSRLPAPAPSLQCPCPPGGQGSLLLWAGPSAWDIPSRPGVVPVEAHGQECGHLLLWAGLGRGCCQVPAPEPVPFQRQHVFSNGRGGPGRFTWSSGCPRSQSPCDVRDGHVHVESSRTPHPTPVAAATPWLCFAHARCHRRSLVHGTTYSVFPTK